MPATPGFNLPYPALSDAPNGPAQFQALAQAVDAALASIGFDGNLTGNLSVSGNATVGGSLTVGGQLWTGAWSSFSPNWNTSAGAAPVIGDGILSGQYIRIGKLVAFNIILVAGSTTTFGDGGFWQFNLPVEATNGFAAAASYRDNSVPLNLAGSADCRNTAGGTNAIIRSNVSSGGGVTNTAPFTWANGDTYKVSGVYQSV